MAALGPAEKDSIVASATRLPIASGAVDVRFSSNVLEHVRDWPAMLAEMVRVTRPGGIIFVTFTNWLSRYGGHETSPWHYLGGERAVAWYQRRHGTMPKNRYGHSLHPVSVADVLLRDDKSGHQTRHDDQADDLGDRVYQRGGGRAGIGAQQQMHAHRAAGRGGEQQGGQQPRPQ